MAQFGDIPPAILPVLVAFKKLPEDKKTQRKLLRLLDYFVQLLSGEGTAGSVVPFHHSQQGQLVDAAVALFNPEQLEAAWEDAISDVAPHYKRTGALRTLAALARSAFVVQPEDTTYMGGLFQIITTVIDKSSNKTLGRHPKQRKGSEQRSLILNYRLQAAALAAARAGLPRPVLTTKMAVRAFNSERPGWACCLLAASAGAGALMLGACACAASSAGAILQPCTRYTCSAAGIMPMPQLPSPTQHSPLSPLPLLARRHHEPRRSRRPPRAGHHRHGRSREATGIRQQAGPSAAAQPGAVPKDRQPHRVAPASTGASSRQQDCARAACHRGGAQP
jgi:hypothetical protein